MPSRGSIRLILLSVLLAGAVSMAQAQDARAPSARSVVAFLNILDHDAVRAAEARVGTEPRDLAEDLLGELEARGFVAVDLTAPLRAALDDDVLDRGAFVLYLADLLDGPHVLEIRDVAEAESRLRSLYCGLVVPPGRAVESRSGPVLDSLDVALVVERFLAADCILPRLRDAYEEPVM